MGKLNNKRKSSANASTISSPLKKSNDVNLQLQEKENQSPISSVSKDDEAVFLKPILPSQAKELKNSSIEEEELSEEEFIAKLNQLVKKPDQSVNESSLPNSSNQSISSSISETSVSSITVKESESIKNSVVDVNKYQSQSENHASPPIPNSLNSLSTQSATQSDIVYQASEMPSSLTQPFSHLVNVKSSEIPSSIQGQTNDESDVLYDSDQSNSIQSSSSYINDIKPFDLESNTLNLQQLKSQYQESINHLFVAQSQDSFKDMNTFREHFLKTAQLLNNYESGKAFLQNSTSTKSALDISILVNNNKLDAAKKRYRDIEDKMKRNEAKLKHQTGIMLSKRELFHQAKEVYDKELNLYETIQSEGNVLKSDLLAYRIKIKDCEKEGKALKAKFDQHVSTTATLAHDPIFGDEDPLFEEEMMKSNF